jgi:hypothetical protein
MGILIRRIKTANNAYDNAANKGNSLIKATSERPVTSFRLLAKYRKIGQS